MHNDDSYLVFQDASITIRFQLICTMQIMPHLFCLCRYEIFRGSEFVRRTKSNTYTFGAGELPEGNTTLWVRAFDPEGADVRASIDVYVAPKSADYNVEEQIFSMDIQQAAGSNDPSMLARAGSLLGTLTDMAKGKSQGSSKGRRLLETAEAADSELAEIVRVKVMQLLAALTSSSASSVMDAATMRQVSKLIAHEHALLML
jgi:hypothetical protein